MTLGTESGGGEAAKYMGELYVAIDSPLTRLVKEYGNSILGSQIVPTHTKPHTITRESIPMLRRRTDNFYHYHISVKLDDLGAVRKTLEKDEEVRGGVLVRRKDDIGIICCYIKSKILDNLTESSGEISLLSPEIIPANIESIISEEKKDDNRS